MASHSAQASKIPEVSMRRSFTLPPQLSDFTGTSRRDAATTPNSQIETLFTHSSVRIVSFTARSKPSTRLSSAGSSVDDEVGTLPRASCLERLVGVGPMSLYRGPGGVAFLSCGKVMHAILPKSQCWCDDARNFVLQIRRPQYYRIELQQPEPEDSRISERLKDVLSKILLLEKTPCPFERSFTVELPEPPVTPPKKRPWRPVQRAEELTENTPSPEATPKAATKAEDVNIYFPSVPFKRSGHNSLGSDSDTTDGADATPRNILHQPTLSLFQKEESNEPAEVVRGRRSVTAPPLTVVTSSLVETEKMTSPLGRSVSIKSSSSDCSSSVNSFHTVQSWHSPITPLPPSPQEPNPASPKSYSYPHENLLLQRRPGRIHKTSEITVVPGASRVWEITRSSSDESIEQYEDCSTPPSSMPTLTDDLDGDVDEDNFEILTPPSIPQFNRQQATSESKTRRRVLSPLPSAANLFSPSRRRPRHLQTSRHLPTAIIQKTCEILLSPPSHLIHLMLNIANKITAGEWRGMGFGSGEAIHKIIGQWDYEDGECILDEWEEDDYGNSLGSKQESNANPQDGFGRSWEID